MFGSTGFEGSAITYLAKAKPGLFPEVPTIKGNATPAFEGDPAGYLEKFGNNDQNRRLLTNKIKKCPNCGKPNAFTLGTCNACGTDLLSVAISFSNNVFVGFALGIQKGPFPLTVSIRHQDEDFLVIDDLLALAPMHFNVMPTSTYVPDWRYLLRKPKEGAALVNAMLSRCGTAAQAFLKNEAWTSKMLKTPFDLQDICAGFNYPPSQYQLHIQYMMPNFLPFQYAQFLKGVHFTYKRFFPVDYVLKCLEVATTNELPAELLTEDASIGSIIDFFDKKGISYDDVIAAYNNRFKSLAAKYAKWESADFEEVVVEVNGKPVLAGKPDAEFNVNDVVNADKLALQNYGRPYNAEGKPVGSFYAFPKKFEDIAIW